jgi:glycosyltransferase involved in cell wall biosynthesis
VSEDPIRVVAVFPSAIGDLSLFEQLHQQDRIDLQVLFTYRTSSGRGRHGQAEFPHRFLPGFMLRRNPQTGTHQAWNQRLRRTLDDLNPDALFVSGYGTLSSVRSIVWASRHGVPWVIYSDSRGANRGPSWKRHLKSALLPPLLSRAAGFLTYGADGERYLRQFGGTAPVAVIGSNRDLRAVAERADAARLTRHSDPSFVFVGRLVSSKGIDLLIEAFRRAHADIPGWSLSIVGDGPLRSRVETASRQLPVLLLGEVPFERVADVLAAADVLVLPSRREPWGEVVAEAMAARVPVIASSAVGAAHHFIEEGVNGWIVPAGSVSSIVSALRSAAASDLTLMGEKARARVLREAGHAPRQLAQLLIQASKGHQ